MQFDQQDKIKYWQYKLSHKPKTPKPTQQPRTAPKTPIKAASSHSTRTTHHKAASGNANFFSSTIDKLKMLLQKPQLALKDKQHQRLKEKQNKSYKELNWSKSKQLNKSTIPNTIELPKQRKKHSHKLTEKQKITQPKQSKVKSTIGKEFKSPNMTRPKTERSKSKSRSRSQRQRGVQSAAVTDCSPPKRKLSKKSKKKEIIGAWTVDFSEESLTRSPQGVAAGLAVSSPPKQQSFKRWELEQERKLMLGRKFTQTINRYVRGFKAKTQFEHDLKRHKRSKKNSGEYLSSILHSQQRKLLELKGCLNNLKQGENIGQGLQRVIELVNQNISYLQHCDYQPSNSKERSLKRSQAQDKVKNQVQVSEVEVLSPPTKPAMWIDSLMISSESQAGISGESVTVSEGVKQDTLLLDSKFNNVNLNKSEQHVQKMNQGSDKKKENVQEQEAQQLVVRSRDQQPEPKTAEREAKISPIAQQGKESLLITPQGSWFIQKYLAPQPTSTPQPSTPEPYTNQLQQISVPVFIRTSTTPPSDNSELLESINTFIQKKQAQIKTPNEGEMVRLCSMVLDEILDTILPVPLLQDHPQLLQRILNKQEEKDLLGAARIASSKEYLLDLAQKITQFSWQHLKLRQKVSQPMGVPPLINLRCLRLADISEEEGEEQTLKQQEMREEMERAMVEAEEKSEILKQEDFNMFEELFSANADSPEQMILNRSLYEAVSCFFDELRPYGSSAIPPFQCDLGKYRPPSYQKLAGFIQKQAANMLSIDMGLLSDKYPSQQLLQRNQQALTRWSFDAIREIQRLHSGENDDALERYELMAVIQDWLIEEQTCFLARFMERI